MQSVYSHKVRLGAALLLVAGLTALVGCISFPDLGPLVDRTVMLPGTTSEHFGDAARTYYECRGRWPASVAELRSIDCPDAEKKQKVWTALEGIRWDALTNQVVFKTKPDGNLAISMSFFGGMFTNNKTSMSWDGGDYTATVEIPKPDEGMFIDIKQGR